MDKRNLILLRIVDDVQVYVNQEGWFFAETSEPFVAFGSTTLEGLRQVMESYKRSQELIQDLADQLMGMPPRTITEPGQDIHR